jgi:hypothetical protein
MKNIFITSSMRDLPRLSSCDSAAQPAVVRCISLLIPLQYGRKLFAVAVDQLLFILLRLVGW